MNDAKTAWSEVQNLRQRIDVATKAAIVGSSFGHAGMRLSDLANTLLVIQACHVLREGLSELCDKHGLQHNEKATLGNLIKIGRAHISDISMIETCLQHRNKIAHGNLTLPRGDCWKYLDAIEKELEGWGVLT